MAGCETYLALLRAVHSDQQQLVEDFIEGLRSCGRGEKEIEYILHCIWDEGRALALMKKVDELKHESSVQHLQLLKVERESNKKIKELEALLKAAQDAKGSAPRAAAGAGAAAGTGAPDRQGALLCANEQIKERNVWFERGLALPNSTRFNGASCRTLARSRGSRWTTRSTCAP